MTNNVTSQKYYHRNDINDSIQVKTQLCRNGGICSPVRWLIPAPTAEVIIGTHSSRPTSCNNVLPRCGMESSALPVHRTPRSAVPKRG